MKKTIYTVTRRPNGTYRISCGCLIILDNLTAQEVLDNWFGADDGIEFEFVK